MLSPRAVLLTLAVAALSACGPSAAPPGALRVALRATPTALDPHLQDETAAYNVLGNVYEGLVGFDGDMRLGPALAESWENLGDTRWRFHLRPGARFHDGRAVEAADVVSSLRRALDHPRSQTRGYLAGVSEVLEVTPTTVEVVTVRASPMLLTKLAFVWIAPRDAPDEIVAPVGSGPYSMTPPEGGEALALRRFAGHWAPPRQDAIDAVTFVSIAAHDERVSALLAGEVDLVEGVPARELARLEGSPEVHLLSRESLDVTYFSFDTRRPPFSDRRVRQAIHLAVDRQALVAETLPGFAHPLGQLAGREVFGHVPSLEPPARDPAAARRLLEAAGYGDGLELTLEQHQNRHSKALTAALAEVGITLRQASLPWDEMYPRLVAGEVAFYYGQITHNTGETSDVFQGRLHTRDPARGYGDSNYGGFSSPELDTVIEEAAAAMDAKQRRKLLERCMRLAMEELPLVPLYQPLTRWGARREVDWRPRLDGAVRVDEIGWRPQGG